MKKEVGEEEVHYSEVECLEKKAALGAILERRFFNGFTGLSLFVNELGDEGWLVRISMPRPTVRRCLLSENFKKQTQLLGVRLETSLFPKNPSVMMTIGPGLDSLFRLIEAVKVAMDEDRENSSRPGRR